MRRGGWLSRSGSSRSCVIPGLTRNPADLPASASTFPTSSVHPRRTIPPRASIRADSAVRHFYSTAPPHHCSLIAFTRAWRARAASSAESPRLNDSGRVLARRPRSRTLSSSLDDAAKECMEPTPWRDFLLRVQHAGFVSPALIGSKNAMVTPMRSTSEAERQAFRANRQPPTDWRRTAHRVATERGETPNHRRRRRRHRVARMMTSLARSMPGHRGSSRRMYARSVTMPLVGRADNATPCVQR
jgi:hypothetical protein